MKVERAIYSCGLRTKYTGRKKVKQLVQQALIQFVRFNAFKKLHWCQTVFFFKNLYKIALIAKAELIRKLAS